MKEFNGEAMKINVNFKSMFKLDCRKSKKNFEISMQQIGVFNFPSVLSHHPFIFTSCCNTSDHRNTVGLCHWVACMFCLPIRGLCLMSAFETCYEIIQECQPLDSRLLASYSLVLLHLQQQWGSICCPWPCYFPFLHFLPAYSMSSSKKKKKKKKKI